MNELRKESFGTTPDAFKLSLHRALHAAPTRPMRRRYPLVLSAALLVVALAGTALAVGLGWSHDANVVRTAKAAVMERYGLSPAAFGLFVTEAHEKDGFWLVTFWPASYNTDALGEYTVSFKDGVATATWTHDDANPKSYADGQLWSKVWGAKQIDAALAIEQESQGDHAKRDRALIAAGASMGTEHTLPKSNDVKESDAIALAKKAITQKYGISPEELVDYRAEVSLVSNDLMAVRYVNVRLAAPGETPDEFHDVYQVQILSPSGEIDHCIAWVPVLPDGPLKDYGEAVAEYMQSDELDKQSAQKKADIAARLIEAGFGQYLNGKQYLSPTTSALTEADAIAKAQQALIDTYGFTSETLTLFKPITAYQPAQAGPVWIVTFYVSDSTMPYLEWSYEKEGDEPSASYAVNLLEDRMGTYRVTLAGDTGAVTDTLWSLAEARGDQVFTEHTWGHAPAVDAHMLPWLLTLLKARQVIADKYDFMMYVKPQMTLEDAAAYDQLFRDAGFDVFAYPNALPDAQDLTQAQALELAKTAICEEYHIDRKLLDDADVIVSFTILDPPAWSFRFWFGGSNDYGVTLDARTGDVLNIHYITGAGG